MKGYYKNPKANAEIFENGWLRTGDIGRYDQNGLVYITDRMKELIKYKGFQVSHFSVIPFCKNWKAVICFYFFAAVSYY